MSSELELVSDGAGLAVIGPATDVERFLQTTGLDRSPSRSLELHRISPALGLGAAAANVGADLVANSGRWVKLTAESAAHVKKYGLMPTKTPGVSHAMIGNPGDVKKWLQIAQGPSTILSGPMALTSIATIMQQRAMQEQMDEIVRYLEAIDAKVEAVLRGQKDAVLADMIGVDLVIDEALAIREHVGRVSDVIWTKVQATGMAIARTQGYALRQLDSIAEQLNNDIAHGDIAKAVSQAELKVQEWLSVLAKTFQLQDGISVLELDRVLDSSPEDLEAHTRGLSTARQNRMALIARATDALMQRMAETADKANSRVLLNPFDSPAAVKSSNQIKEGLITFRQSLGIDPSEETTEARRWKSALAQTRDGVINSADKAGNRAKEQAARLLNKAAEAIAPAHEDGSGDEVDPEQSTSSQPRGQRKLTWRRPSVP